VTCATARLISSAVDASVAGGCGEELTFVAFRR
jgi:hypothetical protein